MDAWFQPAYFHTQSLREDFIIFQHTLTHDCQRQAVRIQTCKVHGDNGAVAFLTYLHGNTFLFRLGQFGSNRLSCGTRECHFPLHPFFRNNSEYASSPVDSLHRVVPEYQRAYQLFSV